MYLLDKVELEVYRAYLPQSLAASKAVNLNAADGGSELEVVHFSKNNFSKNSKNDIQFFEKFRKKFYYTFCTF
jgi:hypothetical protein